MLQKCYKNFLALNFQLPTFRFSTLQVFVESILRPYLLFLRTG